MKKVKAYSKEDIDQKIVSVAEKFRIDANLIRAIVAVESAFNTFAMRCEPRANVQKYLLEPRHFAESNNLSVLTEETAQLSSWGLMQVMGFVARELGFEDHMTKLCIPEVGLYYGCLKLQSLLQKYGEEMSAIAAYNAGSPRKMTSGMFVNQRYVDKVFQELLKLRGIEH
jgi:soluble lytic murein transglycosylase-like protein